MIKINDILTAIKRTQNETSGLLFLCCPADVNVSSYEEDVIGKLAGVSAVNARKASWWWCYMDAGYKKYLPPDALYGVFENMRSLQAWVASHLPQAPWLPVAVSPDHYIPTDAYTPGLLLSVPSLLATAVQPLQHNHQLFVCDFALRYVISSCCARSWVREVLTDDQLELLYSLDARLPLSPLQTVLPKPGAVVPFTYEPILHAACNLRGDLVSVKVQRPAQVSSSRSFARLLHHNTRPTTCLSFLPEHARHVRAYMELYDKGTDRKLSGILGRLVALAEHPPLDEAPTYSWIIPTYADRYTDQHEEFLQLYGKETIDRICLACVNVLLKHLQTSTVHLPLVVGDKQTYQRLLKSTRKAYEGKDHLLFPTGSFSVKGPDRLPGWLLLLYKLKQHHNIRMVLPDYLPGDAAELAKQLGYPVVRYRVPVSRNHCNTHTFPTGGYWGTIMPTDAQQEETMCLYPTQAAARAHFQKVLSDLFDNLIRNTLDARGVCTGLLCNIAKDICPEIKDHPLLLDNWGPATGSKTARGHAVLYLFFGLVSSAQKDLRTLYVRCMEKMGPCITINDPSIKLNTCQVPEDLKLLSQHLPFFKKAPAFYRELWKAFLRAQTVSSSD